MEVSSGYCMLIDEAGIKELDKSKKAIKIKKEVEVTTPEGKRVALKPSNHICLLIFLLILITQYWRTRFSF